MGRIPQVIVLAGPNGAGKSTAAALLIPDGIEYVNADEVAKTLPGYPSREADLAAGRIVLSRLDAMAEGRADFGLETTLAGLSLATRLEQLRRSGYVSRLIFLWTPNPDFSIQRVRARVQAGGHSIPEATIRRRHAAGMVNFFGRYRAVADKWEVYGSTAPQPILVAEGRLEQVDLILDTDVWARFRAGGGDE